MNGLRLEAPSRLHFGPLAWGTQAPRSFGGVGLMIDRPGIELVAWPARDWRAEGPLAARVKQTIEQVEGALRDEDVRVNPLHFEVRRAPAEHVGLGTGTQLSFAVARLMVESSGLAKPDAAALARWTGRGRRSAIGPLGFERGGLIVDGGHRRDDPGRLAPLISRLDLPAGWSVLVIVPNFPAGLHGPEESAAFQRWDGLPDTLTDRLCRIVLLGLLPAAAEGDLKSFGASLEDLQREIGRAFEPFQGGPYAHPALAEWADWLRDQGLAGVGQSSWGPALYAFTAQPAEQRELLLAALRRRFDLGPANAFFAKPKRHGTRLEMVSRTTAHVA